LATFAFGGVALGDTPKKAPAPAPKKAPVARAQPAQAPAKYRRYVTNWHTPTSGKSAPVDESGRPMLALYSLNTNDRVEIPALTDRGGFVARDLDRAAFVLREPHSGNEHPIEPRLLDAIYRIQTHFLAQEIRVISGYRTPHHHTRSNHGTGRAMDIVVPGASDADVAAFAREIGFVGVGVYPASGFVHVDVRERSYFWIDSSAPGRKNRERGVLGDLAKKSDAQARLRGDPPLGPFVIARNVDAALSRAGISEGGRALPTNTPPVDPDDDEDLD
jgi:uncharacterized protein YcbK (DUF882 family)